MFRLTLLDRYIARLIFVPLVGTLILSAMLLLLEQMLRLFDFVVNEGGPVSVVWRMLGNLIPQYLSLGIPIGFLLGVILAFRKLAMQSEMDAISSAGLSSLRLLKVPMLYALVLATLTYGIVGFLQPYSRYAYEGLRFELRSGALGASIKVGEFAPISKNITLRVEESHLQGRELRGIFVHVSSKKGDRLAVTAARGEFLSTDDPDLILFRLHEGTLIQQDKSGGTPRVLDFQAHDLPIDLPMMEAFRSRGGKQRELTLPELFQLDSQRGYDSDFRAKAAADLHRRLAQVAIVFIIPFLGLAFAIPPKRSQSATGVFLGIVTLVVFNEVSEFAERVGASGDGPAAATQWGPFGLFAAFALMLFFQLDGRVGDPPVAKFSRWAEKQGQRLRALGPKAARRSS